MADGGGGGGGGGGSQGGAGGATYGGDDGAYSGSNGASLVPAGGSVSSANNNGGIEGPGGNGYVAITYTSYTGQPMFTGGDQITNNNGVITHIFNSVGSVAQLVGIPD